MTVVNKIVECIKNKYMINDYYEFIESNDRSLVRDFTRFGDNIANKLGNDFELYKHENDLIIFKKDNIYILIEYVFIDFKDIQYEINMFNSMNDVNKYIL